MTVRRHDTTPAHAADAASYLDGFVYKRRIRAVVEPFLVYASQMGEQHRVTVGQGAHVRVKGLGLGCWWVTPRPGGAHEGGLRRGDGGDAAPRHRRA